MRSVPEPAERARLQARATFARQLVAFATETDDAALAAPSRCEAPVARARQVAMYLCHVVFGMSLTEVGRAFGRDRTTAAHACRLVEDLRDDALLDAWLGRLEAFLAAAPRPDVDLLGHAGRPFRRSAA
ncbi:MAG: chromosomal replication initiator DnaA [Alphaproteobacteria bacterium]|nr:chromosomal replication initiator DnaA [Alphaproteobacteria bacterium]